MQKTRERPPAVTYAPRPRRKVALWQPISLTLLGAYLAYMAVRIFLGCIQYQTLDFVRGIVILLIAVAALLCCFLANDTLRQWKRDRQR